MNTIMCVNSYEVCVCIVGHIHPFFTQPLLKGVNFLGVNEDDDDWLSLLS